jgi:hypothetical protein
VEKVVRTEIVRFFYVEKIFLERRRNFYHEAQEFFERVEQSQNDELLKCQICLTDVRHFLDFPLDVFDFFDMSLGLFEVYGKREVYIEKF